MTSKGQIDREPGDLFSAGSGQLRRVDKIQWSRRPWSRAKSNASDRCFRATTPGESISLGSYAKS